MAKIIPFKGITYNPKFIEDFSKVVSPPYDVISKEMQEEFYKNHQYNVIRLILGKIESKDSASDNRYTRAHDYLNNWLDKKVLISEEKDSIYIYQQTYKHKGSLKTRIGFIACMKIEDPQTSKVLPHEYTFAGPKKDRLELISETKANLSAIFSLFEDENLFVTKILNSVTEKNTPFINVEFDGVNHKVWRLEDADSIKRISSFMKDKPVFIADGHHRYETALAFKDLSKEKEGPNQAHNYTMVYFSNLSPEAITILSTHRVVKNIETLDKENILLKLKEFFEISPCADKEKLFDNLEKPGEVRFGLYFGKKFYLLTLKAKLALKKSDFPVTILHTLVFNKILKMKEKVAKEGNLVYTREQDYAISLVDKSERAIAFFLVPTTIDQFKDASEKRAIMPHKSTYFYPKLLSGLVIRKF